MSSGWKDPKGKSAAAVAPFSDIGKAENKETSLKLAKFMLTNGFLSDSQVRV